MLVGLIEGENNKIYKARRSNNINMFPSDPNGSLDVFILNSLAGDLIWKIH